jgi:hypothetical protein
MREPAPGTRPMTLADLRESQPEKIAQERCLCTCNHVATKHGPGCLYDANGKPYQRPTMCLVPDCTCDEYVFGSLSE